MRAAIGFDTSCYTTSAAAVDENGDVIGFQRMLLPVQPGQRGLRQSEAVFAHVKQLSQLTERLKAEIGDAEICAVAAACAPCDGENSYMPVFTVGRNFVMATASLLGIQYFETTHQLGHILAGRVDSPPLIEPFVAVHLSGGTTETLKCEGETITGAWAVDGYSRRAVGGSPRRTNGIYVSSRRGAGTTGNA